MREAILFLLAIVLLIAVIYLVLWTITNLFAQTTELGAIKWGVIVIALAIGVHGSASSRER